MLDHIQIEVSDIEKSKEFYNAALNAGGKDNGKPGIREHYHPNYFGGL